MSLLPIAKNIPLPFQDKKRTRISERVFSCSRVRGRCVCGCVLRGGSGWAVFVDLEEGHVPGLITLSGMEIELSGIIGRKADLRTPEDLSRYFRNEGVESGGGH